MLNRGPPQATVARRAKSYGDFYDVARAQLKKGRLLDKRKRRRSTTEIKNEVDFGKWYDGISEDLLGISIEEYRFVPHLESVCVSRAFRLNRVRSDHTRRSYISHDPILTSCWRALRRPLTCCLPCRNPSKPLKPKQVISAHAARVLRPSKPAFLDWRRMYLGTTSSTLFWSPSPEG